MIIHNNQPNARGSDKGEIGKDARLTGNAGEAVFDHSGGSRVGRGERIKKTDAFIELIISSAKAPTNNPFGVDNVIDNNNKDMHLLTSPPAILSSSSSLCHPFPQVHCPHGSTTTTRSDLPILKHRCCPHNAVDTLLSTMSSITWLPTPLTIPPIAPPCPPKCLGLQEETSLAMFQSRKAIYCKKHKNKVLQLFNRNFGEISEKRLA
jgi:hypothetical protein